MKWHAQTFWLRSDPSTSQARLFPTRPLLVCTLLSTALLLANCGGGGAGGAAGGPKSGGDDSFDGDGSDDGDYEDGSGEGRVAPQEVCDGEVCTRCGPGLCPQGFFCLESERDGPACTWVPACTDNPSCSCLKRTLGDCSCQETDGAPHVSCDAS